jgi:hypothetical protein
MPGAVKIQLTEQQKAELERCIASRTASVCDKSDSEGYHTKAYILLLVGVCLAILVLLRIYEARRAATGRVRVRKPQSFDPSANPGLDRVPWLVAAFLILFCPVQGAVPRMFRVPGL